MNHDVKALLGSGKLGDVVLRVGATNVFLDGSKPLFLCNVSNATIHFRQLFPELM